MKTNSSPLLIATSLNVCGRMHNEAQVIPRLAAAGFEGIDFNFIDMLDRPDWLDRRAADAWVGQLEQAAQAAKLPWVQAHGPLFNPLGQTPHDEKCRPLCQPSIDACSRLGAPWMVLHPGTCPGAFDATHRRLLKEQNVAFFRSLLPACEKARVGIAIENVFDRPAEHRFCSLTEDLCELIDALNHPLIGVCWDTGHAKKMGLEQRSALAALGSRLKALHIQDNDGRDDDHLLPFVNGTTGVDWRAVTAGLKLAGYRGAFTFEIASAFRAVPDELYDASLRHAVATGHCLVNWIRNP